MAISMIEKYHGGILTNKPEAALPEDKAFIALTEATVQEYKTNMDKLAITDAIKTVWNLVANANRYLDGTAPWVLARDEAQSDRLHLVLYNLAEALRIIAILIEPYVPMTTPKIMFQLGQPLKKQNMLADCKWGGIADGSKVIKGEPLFPRIEVNDKGETFIAATKKKGMATLNSLKDKLTAKSEELKKQMAVKQEELKKQAQSFSEDNAKKTQEMKAHQEVLKKAVAAAITAGTTAGNAVLHPDEQKDQIGIDDFAKLDLRVAEILTAERVPKTDKLIQLGIKIGEEERTIVSGIAQHYTPEELIGRHIIVIANLKPAKLRGIESKGMLLAASDGEGNLVLAEAPGIKSGSRVK